MGVASLALFGSCAREEATESSDVDLLVEVDRPVGIFRLLDLQYRLEAILDGAKVDLVPRSSIRPEFAEAVLREQIRAA